LQTAAGWAGLRRHYGLALADVRSIEHALTYQALVSGAVDVIDVFSTDGQLARLDLVVLTDDQHFFPDYAAVLLVRASLPVRLPRTWGVLWQRLVGKIDGPTIARLNARVAVAGQAFAQAAASFLGAGRSGHASQSLRHLDAQRSPRTSV